MTVVWIILAWLLMALGLLGTLLPVLPGTLLIWIGALLYAWATNFQQVDGWLLLVLAILTGATVLAGYVSSAIGARTLGASLRGVAGAMIGGLLGFVVLGPVGVLAGPFAGAILGELAAGRKIQEHYGQKPQDIMTTKMLLGLDGRKMSTSWGNVINITDSPEEQYGKIMSMHDDLIVDYFVLTTNLPFSEIKQLETKLKQKKTNPKTIKGKLAFEVVKRYHGETAAKKAQERFEQLFSKKEFSGDLPLLKLKNKNTSALELVLLSGIAKSKGEAWRLIVQGGFKINKQPHKDPKRILPLKNGDVLQIGKKHFFRVKI